MNNYHDMEDGICKTTRTISLLQAKTLNMNMNMFTSCTNIKYDSQVSTILKFHYLIKWKTAISLNDDNLEFFGLLICT